jgi:hypothetical protein
MEQHLRVELADMYVRAVIAEHSLELEKQAKQKLQDELNKIKHEQSLRAMKFYHERCQAALDFYKKKYEEKNGDDRFNCVHLGEDEID